MRKVAGRCNICHIDVVWVERDDGGWNRPLVPVTPDKDLVNLMPNGKTTAVDEVYHVHSCDPAYRAQVEFRRLQFREAVESVDCPHPRCKGKAGGPCKSLKDGVTDLSSHHPQRVYAADNLGLLRWRHNKGEPR